jgi:leader peptidase (prepilin peptidase) / N-methyltransferase
VNLIAAIPLEVRLVLLFALGTLLGSAANLAIYRLAWNRRSIGPWSAPPAAAPRRRALDRLPIFGWLGLRREAAIHGRGFWLRPMLLELLSGIALAALYWWEIGSLGLVPAAIQPALPADWIVVAHQQYLAHMLLIWLMIVASLIDIDEKIIPDAVTVPGTILGLLLAAVLPWSLLPNFCSTWLDCPVFEFTKLTSPNPWPAQWGGFPQTGSLAMGLLCWGLWCLALLPRPWHRRHGWQRAVRLCWARVVREPVSRQIGLMGLLGAAAIAAVWYYDRANWVGLLSALVGMVATGGLVWIVRILGAAVLKREAMGFGDVTLMAMIGAFLGWQAGLMVFFLAPLAGLVLGLLQLMLAGENEIPYGPFLCLGALVVIIAWAPIWAWALGIFALGWFVPAIVLFCLALMPLLLGLLRFVERLLGWC